MEVTSRKKMMFELSLKLGLRQDHLSPYYPPTNGKVEVVNKYLKTIHQRKVNAIKTNKDIILYPTLWAYQTVVKTATDFSPFQLVHGLEAVLLIECEIPSLKITIEILPDSSELEACLFHLENLYEQRGDATTTNEAHKKQVNS
jgi:hypothetical protein